MFEHHEIGLDHDWRTIRRLVERSKEYTSDPEFQELDPSDFLSFYEEHVRQLENEATEVRLRQKDEKRRRIRKNREGFVSLLSEVLEQGKIYWHTSWADIFPLIKDDERYQNILGNPGSTPIELFWDITDEMTQHVEEQCRIIEVVLAENKKTVSIETTWEDYNAMLSSDAIAQTRVREIDGQGRRNVFEMVRNGPLLKQSSLINW